MLLLAFAGLGASCSDDVESGGGSSIAGRTELQIAFSGNGESQEYTKAAASESENEIKDLKIYLFAANAENGEYQYLETWEEGQPYNPDNADVTKFKKQASGTSVKASIYPNEKKGLPWIKLYCVANNGSHLTTDGKFYGENGADELLATLTKVETDADGIVTTPGTKETEFIKSFTKAIGTDTDTGILGTPLLMTGNGKTKISGSVSKVDITLRRLVARFDIDNAASKTNLTITSLTMAHARKTAPLWGAVPTKVEEADLATDTKLTTYKDVEFNKIANANTGLTESAFYVYPNLATDQSYLIINGTYKSPITSQQVPVTYNIPIVRTPEGADKGEYIAINANNRYTLRISDVTQSNVFASFEVVDWTSGGGIIVKPDNDAPVVDVTKTFAPVDGGSEADLPVALKDADGQTSETDFEVIDDKSFKMTVAATGKVRAEIGAVTKTGEPAWLTTDPPAYEEKDGVWYTTFQLTATGATGKQPLALTFINESASYDPALWTTINFYGPKAVPVFALVDNGNSFGNTTIIGTDGKAPEARLYRTKGSYVTYDITSIEGVTAGTLAGFDVKVEKKAGEEYIYTCKILVSDVANAHDGEIEFVNAADPDKKTTLKVIARDTNLAFEEVAANASVTYTSGTEKPFVTTGKLNIDLDALTTGYSLKINAPAGLTADSLNCPWLTITEDQAWEDVDFKRYAQYTLTAVSDPASTADFDLVFTNKLGEKYSETPNLTITLHKDYSKPKFAAGTTTASWSIFNQGLDAEFTTPTTATISMYKANGSQITVKMTCTEAASLETVTGLSYTKVADNEWQISVDDASALTKATTTVTAHNDGAYAVNTSTDRVATLTIDWLDPKPTFTLDATNTAATVDGGDSDVINVDYATVGDVSHKYVPITINVKGYKGSAITYTGNTASWLVQTVTPTVIGEDGTAEIAFIQSGSTDSATDDIVISIESAITNGGTKTITLKKK